MKPALTQAAWLLVASCMGAATSLVRGFSMATEVLFEECSLQASHIRRHRAEAQAVDHAKSCGVCAAAQTQRVSAQKAVN